ncbi:Translation protein SH3-like domain [Pseudocohnilembus persalinus]|uniref:Translation protein SH3-like domain n=1 Tax=Pseudocohnilembus persalinus TaxID=266149 RepID=A0A0V0QCA6_PSEPJ|nr:Translation protein SH3-like domain [Pseudocohnilembus persalinus]|eukprot:KRW99810.1 Translation protein SH3-like domain [Pseudocohnilembus persalinus]
MQQFFQHKKKVVDSDTDESLNSEEIRVRREQQRRNQRQLTERRADKYMPDYLKQGDLDEQELEKRFQEQEIDYQDQSYDDYDPDEEFKNLLPSRNDPKIFKMVVLNKGEEKDIAFRLLNKFRQVQLTDPKFKIFSVSAMDSQPGYLFFEAHRKIDVINSVKGLLGVKLDSVQLVQDTDIPKIFVVKKQEFIDFKRGQFVQVKAGCYMPYSLDIAKVIDIDQENQKVRIEIIQRKNIEQQQNKGKFIKYTMENRPKKTEKKIQPTIHYKNLTSDFDISQYKKELLDLTDIDDFMDFFEEHKKNLLNSVSNKFKFRSGEIVIAKKGEFQGMKLEIKSIEGNYARVTPVLQGLEDEIWDVQIKFIRKYFRPNQHIQVIGGQHMQVTGEILSIENDIAKIRTDNSNIINVEVDNLILSNKRIIQQQKAKNRSNLNRLDLIKIVGDRVGIVLQVGAEYVRILDENNLQENIQMMQFDSKIDSSKMRIKTPNHDVISQGSQVYIKEGLYKDKKAQVKHVYKDKCFLFSDDFKNQTDSIIVEKGNSLALVSQVIRKGIHRPIQNIRQQQEQDRVRQQEQQQVQSELQNMNLKNPQNNANSNKNLIGTSQMIIGGQYKGFYGVVKKIVGESVTVEIRAKMKTVTIRMSDIKAGDKQTAESIQTPAPNAQSTHILNSPQYNSMMSPAYNPSSIRQQNNF